MINPTLAVGLTLCLSPAVAAQFPGPGLTWRGSQGASAGSFVPSCANLSVGAAPGELVTLTVWGDPMAVFAVFAAGSGSQCLPVPGVGNALVLDLPLLTMSIGTLSQLTPCLSCPAGYEDLAFAIPPAIPRGTSVSFQGASFGAARLAFTVAITATVQ